MTDDEQQPPHDFASLGDIMGELFASEMMPPRESASAPSSRQVTRKASAKLQKAATEIAARPNETEAAYLARELV